MFITLLEYLFLALFTVTFVLFVISLFNNINISERNKRRLFFILLIEIIGVVLIFFNTFYLNPVEKNSKSLNDCLVKNEKDIILQGEIIPYGGIIFRNADSVVVGRLLRKDLREMGFFNSLEAVSKEEFDYTVMKWGKVSGIWTQKSGSKIDYPFSFQLYDKDKSTQYRIINTRSNEIIFESELNNKNNLFDVGNRKLHLLSCDNKFYLFTITLANLQNKENLLVHILPVSIQPILKD